MRTFGVLFLIGIGVLIVTILFGYGLIGTENVNSNREYPTDNVLSKEQSQEENVDPFEGMTRIVGMKAVHLQTIQTVAEQYATISEQRISNITTVDTPNPLLHSIVYINMAQNPERDELMRQEVQKFRESNVYRFEGIPVKDNGAKGCFLSHLHVLAYAAQRIPGQHLLVLEDDFVLDVSYEQLVSHLQEADPFRWDVIILGQYVHEWQPITGTIFRALHSTTTSGYIVHRDYVLDLFTKWQQAFQLIQDKPRFQTKDNLDQIQIAYQKVDVWLAFKTSLGSQRPGTSMIGQVHANNKWRCSDDLKAWIDWRGITHPLKTHPKLELKKVAVCLVATGKYYQFLERVAESCHLKFVKPHPIEFFVFTDQVDKVPSSYFGHPVHSYFVERKGFPGDTLYRYHYMLKAEDLLQHMDNIYYMDVDYWVCNPTETEKILVPKGLVAVKHLHNLHPTTERLKGSPETNPLSTACIPADKSMQFYFCGGFQGGAAKDYLDAMRSIKDAIDTDDRNGIMAVWHDESHWNRYLVDHPPKAILSQSYVYDEACLNPENTNDMATQLRTQGIVPRMVALSKNHQEFQVKA